MTFSQQNETMPAHDITRPWWPGAPLGAVLYFLGLPAR